MDSITLRQLADTIQGELLGGDSSAPVSSVATDSRRIGNGSAFFALTGKNTDGHDYVDDAIENGAVVAVVSRERAADFPAGEDRPVIAVDDTLQALLRLASWWRGEISGRVVAVTGSNGKTILKDALVRALHGTCRVAGSVGSYNSRLGVPLSILRIPRDAEVAVIEVGVSRPGEMEQIEKVVRPDFGILTNVGLSHVAAFGSRESIAGEKLALFRNLPRESWVLAPADDPVVDEAVSALPCPTLRLGVPDGRLPYVETRRPAGEGTVLSFRFPDGTREEALIRTASSLVLIDVEAAVCAAWLLGATSESAALSMADYEPSHTRMEVWRSPTGITLINDSCSSDPISVQDALRSLANIKQAGHRAIFVFGGMHELGSVERSEHEQIGEMAARHRVDMLVLIGDQEATARGFLSIAPERPVLRFEDTSVLSDKLRPELHPGDTILFKGPPGEGIDRVARDVTDAIAYNRFFVDMQAVAENIQRFRRITGPNTRLLAMVKALAYGSDVVRLSRELEALGIDMLGVSTPDEGLLLRRSGVDLPILVTLCTQDEIAKLVRHNLTPVIHSRDLIAPLAEAARAGGRTIDVHLKVDTGMGRLGVMPDQLIAAARETAETGCLRIAGLMTHFSCADDPAEDVFTRGQIERFEQAVSEMNSLGFTDIIRHAANTAGTVRFPESHFDMVRIGLGLYGLYPSPAVEELIELDPAIALVSRVTEIRYHPSGQKIGYGGTFQVPCDGYRVGVIPMGYHDGLPWQLANKGYTLVNGRPARILGRVSMDSAVIDLNGIPEAEVGSNVLIYGRHDGYTLRPEEIAESLGTIVYELITRLGPRVQRIFIGE